LAPCWWHAAGRGAAGAIIVLSCPGSEIVVTRAINNIGTILEPCLRILNFKYLDKFDAPAAAYDTRERPSVKNNTGPGWRNWQARST
jgi:hypothetical protein